MKETEQKAVRREALWRLQCGCVILNIEVLCIRSSIRLHVAQLVVLEEQKKSGRCLLAIIRSLEQKAQRGGNKPDFLQPMSPKSAAADVFP